LIDKEGVQILVVDDEEAIREVLHRGISLAGYPCTTARDGSEALDLMRANHFDLVITDIKMPGMDGIELADTIREHYDTDIIIMTGFVEDFTYEKIINRGASDFIEKPIGIKELIIRLERVVAARNMIFEKNRAVEEQKRSLEKLQRTMDGFIQAMSLTVETRDPYTAGHQRRVADIACRIAALLGLCEDTVTGIRMAGIIHDLGKIYVPAEILNKPGRLTELEFGIIKTHAQVGYDILKEIDFPWPIAEVVLQHHELMDGSGYPQALAGGDIRLEARIMAVADVVEAIASHRPYRPALGIEAAVEEISKRKGVCYDADVVDACVQLFKEGGLQI
jgi:response regulator RpfG family c-di-GMP phosphodiesterase